MNLYDEPRLTKLAQSQFLKEKDVDETDKDVSTFEAIVDVIGKAARTIADTVNPMTLMQTTMLDPEKGMGIVKGGLRLGANTVINTAEDALKLTADMEDSLRQMGLNIPAFSLDEMRFKSSDEMLEERKRNAMLTGDATSDMNLGRVGNRTELEKMLEPITSFFLTSYLGGGINKARGILTGSATIDLNEGNLSTVLKEFGILPQVTEYLSSKPEDAEVGYERLFLRTKNLVEEGVLSAAVLAMPLMFKALKDRGVQFTLGTAALTSSAPEDAEAGGLGSAFKEGAKILDSLGFFSEAVEQTKNLKQEKGTGPQFLSLLKKAGVKDEELKWTGVDELLKNKKVTKQEILDQLESEAVTLEEIPKTVRQEDLEMNFSASEDNVRLDDLYLKDVAKGNDEPDKKLLKSTLTAEDAYGPEYLNNRADEIFEDDDQYARFTSGENTNLTIDDAYNQAVEEYYDSPIRIYEDENTGIVITGNDDVGYSIFNNRAESSSWKNRRKTLNNDEVVYDLDEAKIQAQQLAEDEGRLEFGGDVVQYSDYIVSGGDNYREFLLTLPNQKGRDFTAGHFPEENIVAHFRTTDIKGPNGEKALFIEEIQSDWAQQGRRGGFSKTEEELKEISAKRKEAQALVDKYTEQVKETGKDLEGKELDEANMASNYLSETAEFITRNDGKPPTAPFVSDPKYQRNWTALSIKRILAKAVEEGYEYVSFATGESGAAQNYFARSNDNIKKYYGETVPSVLNKIVKKYDSEAITPFPDYPTVNKDLKREELVFKNSLKVKLTDKLKNAIKEGQALFAIPAAVTGAGVAMNNTNEMRN